MLQKTLLISPHAAPIATGRNPKDYPYWGNLIEKMKAEGWTVWQIGINNEPVYPGVDKYYDGLNYRELEDLARQATVWVSVDNFFHHFCTVKGIMGVVIFGISDPNIFGHPTHFNLLKDRKYLRGNQYNMWVEAERNPDAFLPSEEVIAVIKKVEAFKNEKGV
jgi:hypothetical protein